MLPGKKITPKDILAIARRRVFLLVAPVLVSTFAALTLSASLPNIYQAEMLVQTIPARVPDSFVRSTVTMKTSERLDQVTQQVTSRTQIEQLILDLDLYPAERRRLPLQDVVNLARRNIEVKPVLGPRNMPTDSFTIKFAYSDPRVAARVVDRLGSLFVNENARDRGALADATNVFLETQLAEARSRLETQERKLEEFRQTYAGKLPSQLESNLQAVQGARNQAQALVEALARDRDRKLMLERLYNEAIIEPIPVSATPVAAPPAQAATPIAVPGGTVAQQLAAARASLERLLLRLKPEHPDVVRTQRLIVDLERKADAEPAAPSPLAPAGGAPLPLSPDTPITPEVAQRRERLRQMRADIDSVDRQIAFKEAEEQKLRQTIREYQQRIEAVPGLESEWIALTRDYDTLQDTYKELLSKSEQSKVAAELERRQIGEQFRVLDAARAPSTPISPNRLQINAIGLGAGLLLGLGLVAFLELRDSSFRTEQDVLEVLALPVVALVPIVETTAERIQRRRRRALFSAGLGLVATAGAYLFWTMQLWKHVV